MFSFEFDEAKSQANFSKHGINFIDAQMLWHDPMLLEIPAKTADEPRYLVIGLIEGKHGAASLLIAAQLFRLFLSVDHELKR